MSGAGQKRPDRHPARYDPISYEKTKANLNSLLFQYNDEVLLLR
jgi:hypothetical protein